MASSIYLMFELAVKPGQFAPFRAMVAEAVAAARTEPNTLAYEYSANADGSVVHIFEHYRDSDSIVSHVDETFAPFGERFASMVDVERLTVYGNPDENAKARLDPFGARYIVPFDGFFR